MVFYVRQFFYVTLINTPASHQVGGGLVVKSKCQEVLFSITKKKRIAVFRAVVFAVIRATVCKMIMDNNTFLQIMSVSRFHELCWALNSKPATDYSLAIWYIKRTVVKKGPLNDPTQQSSASRLSRRLARLCNFLCASDSHLNKCEAKPNRCPPHPRPSYTSKVHGVQETAYIFLIIKDCRIIAYGNGSAEENVMNGVDDGHAQDV